MPTNVNYNGDILFYPVTGNMSDVTNSDIIYHKEFSIKVLSLVPGAGIAVRKSENGYYNHKDYPYENYSIDEFEVLEIVDGTSLDMTVHTYFEYTIYFNKDTNGFVAIDAYLYDIDKKKISDVYSKNVSLNYIYDLSFIDINPDFTNLDYDGTVVYNKTETNDFINIDYITIESIAGAGGNKNGLYINDICNYSQGYTNSLDDLIYTITSDPNFMFNYSNIVNINIYDINDDKISNTYKYVATACHGKCIGPVLDLLPEAYNGGLQYSINVEYIYYPPCVSAGTNAIMVYEFKNINKYQTDYKYPSLSFPNELVSYINFTTQAPTKLKIGGTSLNYIESVGEIEVTPVEHDSTIYPANIPNFIYDDTNIDWHIFKVTNSSVGNKEMSGGYNDALYQSYDNGDTWDNSAVFSCYNYYMKVITMDNDDDNNTQSNYDYGIYINNYTIQSNSIISQNTHYTNLQPTQYEGEVRSTPLLSNFMDIDKFDNCYYMPTYQPLMLKAESNHKIKVSIYDRNINMIDTVMEFILEAGEILEIPVTESGFNVLNFQIRIVWELLECSATVEDFGFDATFSIRVCPINTGDVYISKKNDQYNTLTNIDSTSDDINITFFRRIEKNTINGTYHTCLYKGDSDQTKITLNKYNNNNVIANVPMQSYNKTDNAVEVNLQPFSKDTSNTLGTLSLRVYQADETITPDYTNITNLDTTSIIHVYDFVFGKDYKIDYFFTPNDTSILPTIEINSGFSSVKGYCDIPLCVMGTDGIQTLTCYNECKPSYNYQNDEIAVYSKMHNITYQSDYSGNIEKEIIHPNTTSICSQYPLSNTVQVCLNNGAINTNVYLSQWFSFSCIGTNAEYASSEVKVMENYPDHTYYPMSSFYNTYPGSNYQYLYRFNYLKGTCLGSCSATLQYRKNGSATQLTLGTGSYYSIPMTVGETIEVRQKNYYDDTYAYPSQSIKRKRQA